MCRCVKSGSPEQIPRRKLKQFLHSPNVKFIVVRFVVKYEYKEKEIYDFQYHFLTLSTAERRW